MQAEGLIGSPMTYSLFEAAKEKGSELIAEHSGDIPEAENTASSVSSKYVVIG